MMHEMVHGAHCSLSSYPIEKWTMQPQACIHKRDRAHWQWPYSVRSLGPFQAVLIAVVEHVVQGPGQASFCRCRAVVHAVLGAASEHSSGYVSSYLGLVEAVLGASDERVVQVQDERLAIGAGLLGWQQRPPVLFHHGAQVRQAREEVHVLGSLLCLRKSTKVYCQSMSLRIFAWTLSSVDGRISSVRLHYAPCAPPAR